MAKKTFYVVQPYEAGKRGALKPGVPVEVASEDQARRKAERIAGAKLGAIAFSREVGPDSDDAEAPVFIASFGRVPEDALEPL
jgi:hypothetical protein